MRGQVGEVLEIASNEAKSDKKAKIIPRHILLGIRQDMELDEFCRRNVIAQGGVLPPVGLFLSPGIIKRSKQKCFLEE